MSDNPSDSDRFDIPEGGLAIYSPSGKRIDHTLPGGGPDADDLPDEVEPPVREGD